MEASPIIQDHHTTEDSAPMTSFSKKAALYHERIPGFKRLPLPVVGIILCVGVANILVWVVIGIVLYNTTRALVSTAVLAYVLGLRHALDADHISAIDLSTRRLVAAGQRPVMIGMFFSLGHSTIVIITSIVVAATAAAVRDKFDKYGHIGGIIGSSVSAGFLIILGIMNVFILYKLIKDLNKALRTHASQHRDFKIAGAGCLLSLFRKMFTLIDRPWKLYPLGVMFGLGFDTSSEVALLGISSIQAAKGTSIWLILIFPTLFTAGMCLLDTTDGALMMALYTSTALARDQIAILYYSTVLTVITIIVAVVVGVIQLLTLIRNTAEPTGRFWDGVEVVEDHYDIIGLAICISFLVFGGISVLVYTPWRRYMDRREHDLDEQRTEGSVERDALLRGEDPMEGYDEGLEGDTSLHRPGGDRLQQV